MSHDENPAHDTNMRVQDNLELDCVFRASVGMQNNVIGYPILYHLGEDL